MSQPSSSCLLSFAMVGMVALGTGVARAQIEFTEIMHSPGGVDALWEWVEIRNTSAAAVDLDGWVLDDDDDPGIPNDPNIRAGDEGYNTIVPAGGVAVLYPGDELDFMPQRFTDAWGSGITLIPVRGLTALTAGDAIGLWPNYGAYQDDAIDGAMMSPRRTFTNAVATIDYTGVEFTAPDNGHSIAWNGSGSAVNAANWRVSELNQPGVIESMETTIASAQINDTSDRGNPGAVPSGPATAGLLITEIMFAPASPMVEVGFNEDDFEWVEVYNNTSSAIDFVATPYVFDDVAGSALGDANVDQGEIGVGETGVLFHDDVITLAHMQAMWDSQINFIPVAAWPALNNSGGDTIAIWDSLDAYENEPETGSGRTHENAVAAVTYNTLAGEGWPTINDGDSIFLRHLTDDPSDPASWMRAGTNGESLSANALPIFQTATDHPGDDVGSPGFVPTVIGLPGDYNGDGWVDAADYTVWRDHLGEGDESALNGNGDGNNGVDAGDYSRWVVNFGNHSGGNGSGSLTSGAVPEPGGVALVAIGVGGLFMRRRRRPILRSPLQFVGR